MLAVYPCQWPPFCATMFNSSKYITMIKTRYLVAIAALAFAPLAHAQMKIGVVDMNRIFTSYHKTKDAEAKLNEARTSAKAELDKKIDKLKAGMNEVNDLNAEAQKPGLSEEARRDAERKRDNKVADVRELDKEIAEFRTAQERQLQEQYMRMRKDILEDIMRVVTDKVKTAGYDLVFDKSGLSMGQVPVVVYSRPEIDFTKEIVDALAKK